MIKLIDILNEDKKYPLYDKEGKLTGFAKPQTEDPESPEFEKGYKSIKTYTEPETGASVTEYERLPKFDDIRRKIIGFRREFQPFKYSSNDDVAKVAKDLNTKLTQAAQLVFALSRMIELQQKTNEK